MRKAGVPKLFASAAGLLTLVPMTPGHAQTGPQPEAAPPTPKDTSAVASGAIGPEDQSAIIVTAQKRAEREISVPISVTVLPGTLLDRSTKQSLNDVLNTVPGVYIPPIGILGVSQIAVRGVTSSGIQWSGASPVAYYLDAVPFGFARSAYIPDSDVYDLSRVEVLRGPQGTLYGANAEDGVVRVITNDADLDRLDLKARVIGSETEYGGLNGAGDVAVNIPVVNGVFAVRGVLSYKDLSGWIDRPGRENANYAHLLNYRVKAAIRPADNLRIDLSAWNSRDRFGAPPTGLPDGPAPDTGTTDEPILNKFQTYSAKIAYDLPYFTITNTTSDLHFTSYIASDLTPLGGFFTGLNVASNLESKVFANEFLVNSSGNGPWYWTSGAFYRRAIDYNEQIAEPGDIGYVNFRDESKSYAVFGQIERRFFDDHLGLTAGLRYFHDVVSTEKLDPTPPPSEQQATFHATTPRFVITWYPNKQATVYASYSQGFRSGFPQYYATTDIYPQIPAAKPDKLNNYELGAKANLFGGKLAVDAAAFYVKWNDVQQTIPAPLPGGGFLNAILNGPSASGPGAEISVTVLPLPGLNIGGALSWNGLKMDGPVDFIGANGNITVFHKGDRINASSEYTAGANVSYTFDVGDARSVEISGAANYTKAQEIHGLNITGDAPVTTHGDNLIFLSAALEFNFSKNWTAKLFGDNLTNEQGSITGFDPNFGPHLDETLARPRPRTIGISLEYRMH